MIANLDRVRRLTEGDERLERPLTNALSGAERAAQLTGQLLAFARRQPLQAEDRALNPLIASALSLATGSLPPTVRLETDLAADLWPVRVDGNQTENALLNLWSMPATRCPAGGVVTIRSYNAAAGDGGDRVILEVADTGVGMSAETRARVFEPFFTTKGVGEGTGLGLSQVYGFVTQSGGTIAIESAPGRGTTVRIALPRIAALL